MTAAKQDDLKLMLQFFRHLPEDRRCIETMQYVPTRRLNEIIRLLMVLGYKQQQSLFAAPAHPAQETKHV